MLDPYLQKFINPDASSVTFDTRETVQLQDAISRLTDDDLRALWLAWSLRERQQFFFVLGKVYDLDVFIRVVRQTIVYGLRHELQTEMETILAERMAELDEKEKALNKQATEITLSINAALRIQQENTSLRDKLQHKDGETAELWKKLRKRDDMVEAAQRMARAITALQAAENGQ